MAKSKYTTVGVSFPDETLLTSGRDRAARLGMSFSRYITYLIEQDLQVRGNVVLRERIPDAAPAITAAGRSADAVADQFGIGTQAVELTETLPGVPIDVKERLGAGSAAAMRLARAETSEPPAPPAVKLAAGGKAASPTGGKSGPKTKPAPGRPR